MVCVADDPRISWYPEHPILFSDFNQENSTDENGEGDTAARFPEPSLCGPLLEHENLARRSGRDFLVMQDFREGKMKFPDTLRHCLAHPYRR